MPTTFPAGTWCRTWSRTTFGLISWSRNAVRDSVRSDRSATDAGAFAGSLRFDGSADLYWRDRLLLEVGRLRNRSELLLAQRSHATSTGAMGGRNAADCVRNTLRQRAL